MGKWSQREYEQQLCSKIKCMFERCILDFPEESRRDHDQRFRTFIRELDVDHEGMQASFMSLVNYTLFEGRKRQIRAAGSRVGNRRTPAMERDNGVAVSSILHRPPSRDALSIRRPTSPSAIRRGRTRSASPPSPSAAARQIERDPSLPPFVYNDTVVEVHGIDDPEHNAPQGMTWTLDSARQGNEPSDEEDPVPFNLPSSSSMPLRGDQQDDHSAMVGGREWLDGYASRREERQRLLRTASERGTPGVLSEMFRQSREQQVLRRRQRGEELDDEEAVQRLVRRRTIGNIRAAAERERPGSALGVSERERYERRHLRLLRRRREAEVEEARSSGDASGAGGAGVTRDTRRNGVVLDVAGSGYPWRSDLAIRGMMDGPLGAVWTDEDAEYQAWRDEHII